MSITIFDKKDIKNKSEGYSESKQRKKKNKEIGRAHV